MGKFVHGDKDMTHSDLLVWGINEHGFDTTSEKIMHWGIVASYPDGTLFRVWTYDRNLMLEDEEWIGVGISSIQVGGGMASSKGNENNEISITIGAIPDEMRSDFLNPPGVVNLRLVIIWSSDGGRTWQKLNREMRGVLSQPAMTEDGFYRFRLQTRVTDVDRGRPYLWSDAAQKQRHPTDRAMEHLDSLADGVEWSWPPLS